MLTFVRDVALGLGLLRATMPRLVDVCDFSNPLNSCPAPLTAQPDREARSGRLCVVGAGDMRLVSWKLKGE